MSGLIERLHGWPALPELFGWVESGFPGVHTVPGLHGIRVEEPMADGICAAGRTSGHRPREGRRDHRTSVRC